MPGVPLVLGAFLLGVAMGALLLSIQRAAFQRHLLAEISIQPSGTNSPPGTQLSRRSFDLPCSPSVVVPTASPREGSSDLARSQPRALTFSNTNSSPQQASGSPNLDATGAQKSRLAKRPALWVKHLNARNYSKG
jgi:hypothetical protein